MRLIDADALKIPHYITEEKDLFIQGYQNGKVDAIIEIVALAPTVDAVEVVRCANCLWFDMTGYEEDNQDIEPYLQTGFCRIWGKDAQMCDFCSYGERRTNEG